MEEVKTYFSRRRSDTFDVYFFLPFYFLKDMKVELVLGNLLSVPELNGGECRFNNSITATASDLRFSPIERGEVRTSFFLIMYEMKSF